MLAMEQLKQSLGCDKESCLAEIGGAIGADYLITGSVIRMDDVFLLQFQLVNIRGARVEQRVSREYKGGPQGLLEETRTATKLLVRDILAQRSGKLAIAVSVEGASIKVDGAIVGVSPLGPFETAGGMHTLAVEKQGFVLFTRDVEIVAKQTTQVEVALAPSAEYKRDYEEQSGRTRMFAYGGMGLGAAGVIGGVASYLVSRSRATELRDDIEAYNDPNHARTTTEENELNERRRGVARLDATALVCGGVGVVALAAGVILYVTGDDPDRFQAPSLDVTVGTGGASVTWRY